MEVKIKIKTICDNCKKTITPRERNRIKVASMDFCSYNCLNCHLSNLRAQKNTKTNIELFNIQTKIKLLEDYIK